MPRKQFAILRRQAICSLPDEVFQAGNTLDIANATWTNTIGDPELVGVGTDLGFDSNVRAFYYARVLEIPTPRWTAYDAKYFKIKLGSEVPLFVQDLAYTSPIRYTP